MKILEMRARREDLRQKAMALIDLIQKEERFLSDDEEKQLQACGSMSCPAPPRWEQPWLKALILLLPGNRPCRSMNSAHR